MSYKTDIKAKIMESIFSFRASINNIVDAKWSIDPFGKELFGSKDQYIELFHNIKDKSYPEIDKFEKELGYKINKDFLDELAFHTQVVIKDKELNYQHGRVIYSLVRKYIETSGLDFINIIETGTARGFSAICMAKAIKDSKISGHIDTVDVLSHLRPQIWNCIDDLDGIKSRQEILSPWHDLTNMITFFHADTLYAIPRIGVNRINIAFLDAQHIKSSVINEFNGIRKLQKENDIIIFDDVSEDFPGVVDAVKEIDKIDEYSVNYISSGEGRSYAYAEKQY